MAKKRRSSGMRTRTIYKTRTVRAPFKRKSYRRANKSTMLAKYIGAGVYGGARGMISQKLQPLTANIPLGGISDEVAMLMFNWAGNKFVGRKVPMLKGVFQAGMLIESARLGEAIVRGEAGIPFFGNNNNTAGAIGQTVF